MSNLFLHASSFILIACGFRAVAVVPTDILDVTIVGGGIGGTYTGWTLRDRGLKITIFENTDRIGGRLFSLVMPSVPTVPADMGAMRYHAGVHVTLENLIESLGLQSEVFQPDQFEKMYYFRGKRMNSAELNTAKLPFSLAPGESRNADELLWQLSKNILNMSNPDQIEDNEEILTADGVPLYEKGILSGSGAYWSNEGKEYVKIYGGFWSEYELDINAVHFLPSSNPNSPGPDIRTVTGGLNTIPRRLADQFQRISVRHSIKLNRRVGSIRRVLLRGETVYQLTVFKTATVDGFTNDIRMPPDTVYTKQVILAVPSQALQKIRWSPLQENDDIRKAYEATEKLRASKIFLAYPNAWWDRFNINYKAFLTDLPLVKGGEFGRYRNSRGQETAVMLVSYVDGEGVTDYWKGLRNFSESVSSPAIPLAYSVSKKVVEHVHYHLSVLYGVTPREIPTPLDGVMHVWDDDQYGRAWEFYRRGFKPKEVAQSVRRPSPSDRVYVVTNSFSRRFSSWSEGSLLAADSVLREFFNVV